MPRFFQPMGAPLTFEPIKIAQGASIATPRPKPQERAPTDEERKRAAMSAAYTNSLVDKSPAAVPVESITGGSEDSGGGASGLSLNIPQTGQLESDPQKYQENLSKLGYGDLAQQEQERQIKMQQDQEVLNNTKTKSYAENTRAAFALAAAGDIRGAITTANRVHGKGEKITGIQPLDKTNFRVFSEDQPDGHVINADEVDSVLLSAEKRMDRYFPPQYSVVGDKIVMTQRHASNNKLDLITTVDNPAVTKTDPYEKKLAEESAVERAKLIGENSKLDTAITRLEDAGKGFADFKKTGTFYNAGMGPTSAGRLALDKRSQSLDRKFKALNLDDMVSTFQGMSRAVDSDAEREFFEQKQPSMANKDIVNAQIISAAFSLKLKAQADNAAKAEYADANHTLKGYTSPVIGKQEAVFTEDGQAVLIDKDKVPEVTEHGYYTIDSYAEAFNKGLVSPPKSDSKYLYQINPETFKLQRKLKPTGGK